MKKKRLPVIVGALICLVMGVLSGLTRIGWDTRIGEATAHHGAIMVGGFLGTLIGFEKIIPLRRKLLYAIPVINALSVVFFLKGNPDTGIVILTLSSLALSSVFFYYLCIHRSMIYLLMLIGAVCWLTGNVLLFSKQFYPLAFPWWAAFALFVIVAERMELMQFLPVSRIKKQVLVAVLMLFLSGVVFSFHGIGNLLSGIALIVIALWLLRYDIIGVNVYRHNLPKYVAISLLCGYIALLLTGIFFLLLSDQWLNYDLIVHTFFIGFVFSMIFAHGPVILPGVLGISAKPFHWTLYVWLILLQSSWTIRMIADVLVEMEVRKWSGLLTAVAMGGYFVTMATLTFKGRRGV